MSVSWHYGLEGYFYNLEHAFLGNGKTFITLKNSLKLEEQFIVQISFRGGMKFFGLHYKSHLESIITEYTHLCYYRKSNYLE